MPRKYLQKSGMVKDKAKPKAKAKPKNKGKK
jgi:hypothetical protein